MTNCNQFQNPAPAPEIEYVIFNNAGSTTYDVSLYAGVLQVGGTQIPWTNLGKGASAPSEHKPTVAIAQVDTLTPNVLACGCQVGSDVVDGNVIYSVNIAWKDNCGRQWSKSYSAPVCCTGLTATLAVAAITSVINADTNGVVTASGTTTLILTATTAGQGFYTTATTGAASPSPWLSLVHTTANVPEFGNPADFINQYFGGVAPSVPAAFVSSSTYILMKIPYTAVTPDTANPKGSRVQAVQNHTLYVFVESGGTAEVNVLSGGQKLCMIFAGDATVRNYLAVSEATCS